MQGTPPAPTNIMTNQIAGRKYCPDCGAMMRYRHKSRSYACTMCPHTEQYSADLPSKRDIDEPLDEDPGSDD